MDIIDFHTHVFPDDIAPRAIEKVRSNSSAPKNHTNGTVSGLLDSMKKNSIIRSVLLSIATKPSQVHTINETCSSLKSDHLVPFGTLHPMMDNIEDEIRFLKDNNIKGIKLHPEYQDFFINDPKHLPMYEQLSAENIMILFHAGKDPGPFTCDHALPPAIKKISKIFPDLTIIAAHLGGWNVWNDVEEHLCGLPIYFDTSALYEIIDPQQFIRIVRKHGTEKILFGTDSPWFDQGKTVQWLLELPLTDSEKENILSLNALNLLT